MYYHGARYYVPWLGRWYAVDPLESKYAGMSPYNYSFNNPVVWNDLSGSDPKGDEPIQLNIPNAPSGFQEVPTADNTTVERPVMVDGGLSSGVGSSENPIPLEDIPIVDNTTAYVFTPEVGRILSEQELSIKAIKDLNPALSKAISNLGVNSSFSQSRAEYKFEKEAREAQEYNDLMLVNSQDNPVIGAFHFVAGDVTGTIEMVRSSYESFSDKNYGKGAVYTGFALLGVSGYAGGVSRNVGRAGWLAFHEGNTLGHTISKHIGKTDAELISRLNSSSRISGASTFTNQGIAEEVISSTIKSNRSSITAWLRSGSSTKLALDYAGDNVIGRGIMRGQTAVSDLFNARIVLKPIGNGRYNILTAFTK